MQEKCRKWDQYVDYLSAYHQMTDWIFRDEDYPECQQFPSKQNDFRDEIDRKMVYDQLREQLKTLSQREMFVLVTRFGLGGEAFTFAEIGMFLNVQRERVRQIQEKALRKMRHPKRSSLIWKMLEDID